MTGPIVNQSRGAATATSLGLLARVKAREQGSWEQLVGLYSPLVYHWCRRAHLSAEDAEDVGQEVFRAVFRKFDDFRHEEVGQSFRGWLRRIVQRKVIDHARKKELFGVGGSDFLARIEAVPAPDEATDDEETPDEHRILLRQALKQLEPKFKPDTWQSFWQVVAEGRSPEVVARERGVNVNSVYLAKSRVLSRFREEFPDLVEP